MDTREVRNIIEQ